MTELKLLEAVNNIDDDLIEESDKQNNGISGKIRIFGTVAAALIMTVGAVGIINAVNASESIIEPPSASENIITANSDSTHAENETDVNEISSMIDSTEVTDEQTEPSEAVTDEMQEKTDIFTNSNEWQNHTDIPANDDEPITPDSFLKTDLSDISLDEWKQRSDVVWGQTDLKGESQSEPLPLGTAEISYTLSELMQNGTPDTVYAATVDFSSCIDENELLDWEYGGNTISALQSELSAFVLTEETSVTYTDSSGTHTEYFSVTADNEKFADINEKISEIKYAYYERKIQDFKDTFDRNGMGIFTETWAVKNHLFYTFGTRSHFEEFVCGETEVFKFYPADSIK